MSAIATRTFTQAFDAVRSLLNDTANDVYTDAMLLEKGTQIHGEIQDEFATHGIQFGEAITALTYTTPNTSIGSLPADMVEPLDIWERLNTSEEWQPMTRVDQLDPPTVSNPDRLTYWEWSEDTLKVNPASVSRLIRMRYQKQVAYPTASATMGTEDVYWALVYGTAWLAALGTGRESLAAVFGPKYEDRKADALTKHVHMQQKVRRGPQPYRTGVSG